jgi:uncharacterized protein involved in exopolysaccharide biosynthesis
VSSASENWINPDDTIDLRALLGKLWEGRWWIVASVVICAGIAVAIALTMTPFYRAAVVMVPANTERSGDMSGALGQFGGLASLAGLNIGGAGMETEESLAVLRSREFTEKFIQTNNLMPVLFADRWNEKEQNWCADAVPPTPAQAYKYFNKTVRAVIQDKKTGLVTVQIDWKDRQLAADWANQLVQRLNSEMRARAIGHANASLGFLEKELDVTSVVGTRDAINRLIESQIKQRMLANVTQEYAFRVVDRAMPSDKNDPVRPKKRLLAAGGVLIGVVLGIIVVIIMSLLRSGRRVA